MYFYGTCRQFYNQVVSHMWPQQKWGQKYYVITKSGATHGWRTTLSLDDEYTGENTQLKIIFNTEDEILLVIFILDPIEGGSRLKIKQKLEHKASSPGEKKK